MDGKETARTNGFQGPYTKRQCTAVAVVLADGAIFGAVISLMLESTELWIFTSLFYAVWIGLATTGLTTMGINPADPSVSESDPYCIYCHSHVKAGSKHCSDCRKCVAKFDHHCPWLNNCVGSRNYSFFFASVWLVLAMCGLIATASAMLLWRELEAGPDTRLAYIFVLSAVLLINLMLWLLDLTLLGFHCYLCWRGITTYDYIKAQRQWSAMKGAPATLPVRPPKDGAAGNCGSCSSSSSCRSGSAEANSIPCSASSACTGNASNASSICSGKASDASGASNDGAASSASNTCSGKAINASSICSGKASNSSGASTDGAASLVGVQEANEAARGEAAPMGSSPRVPASDGEMRHDRPLQIPGVGGQRQACANEQPGSGRRGNRSSISTPTRAVSNELELFIFGSVDPGDSLLDQRNQV